LLANSFGHPGADAAQLNNDEKINDNQKILGSLPTFKKYIDILILSSFV
jgi:hypothetical protein